MNAEQIKFGIEIETHLPNTSRIRAGGYHSGRRVWELPPNSDGNGWTAERDGSIHAPAGRRGCEFVSPILVGRDGLQYAFDSIKKIRDDFGAKVNATCGTHVTITFPANDAPALARLVCMMAHFEDGLYATTGTRGRERGIYCRKAKSHGIHEPTNRKKADAYAAITKRRRFHGLNLTHLANGSNRVEFRLFSGSTNPAKLIAWIRLVLAIAEYALKTTRCVSYDSRSEDGRWGGMGECSLVGLLCKLGWLKWRAWGYRGTTYGIADGDIDATPEYLSKMPTLKQATRTLRGLAKKYDAQS